MLNRNILVNRILPYSILVCVLVAAGFVYLSSQTSKTAEAAWYSSSWTYRKTIIIDHTELSTAATSTFSNFPLLVSVTDSDLASTGNGGKQASSTGLDILFTDSDGVTKLDHEIESYSSTTGQLIAWVRIPTLTSSSDYPIYIYFGNASAADQSNKTGVWDSNYQAVWHMGDKAATTNVMESKNGYTSTANRNTSLTATSGKIDGAQNLNGSSDYIGVTQGGHFALAATAFTLSTWVNVTAFGGDGNFSRIISWYDGTNSLELGNYTGNSSAGGFYLGKTGNTNSRAGSSQTYSTGTPLKLDATYDGSSYKLFVNGIEDDTSTTTYNGLVFFSSNSTTLYIGQRGDGARYLNGIIDETRISSSARSADWIKTEYNSQNSPSTFYSIGAATSQAPTSQVKTGNFVQVGGKFRQVGGKIEIK